MLEAHATQTASQEGLAELFSRYKDEHADMILADGIGRICDDLQVRCFARSVSGSLNVDLANMAVLWLGRGMCQHSSCLVLPKGACAALILLGLHNAIIMFPAAGGSGGPSTAGDRLALWRGNHVRVQPGGVHAWHALAAL